MKILEAGRDSKEAIYEVICPPETESDETLRQTVAEIIADVRARGDEAVIEYGRRFDYPDLENLRVADEEIDAAYEATPAELVEAVRRSVRNVRAYHEKQLRGSWMDISPAGMLGQIVRPIERVGVYAPAGLAPLPSSVIMTAVPAVVAGVPEVILCSVPQKDGNIHAPMLVAARESGIIKVFKASGAQAVAAMAYGTQTIPQVDKIAGPGNQFVAEAKRQVFGIVGIDMIAGPSEVVILADETANPKWLAMDLIAQAEHSPDARSILITPDRALADAVLSEVRRQRDVAARAEIVKQSLAEFGAVILARDMKEAIELVNDSAPEHLEIVVKDPAAILPLITNAGAIMLGDYTPVSLGDYAAGPSHTLPTARTARFSSGLGVDDFIKKSSIIWYSREGLADIADTVARIAESEGLQAHADSALIRLEDKRNGEQDG